MSERRKKEWMLAVQVVPDPPKKLTWAEATQIAMATLAPLAIAHGEANFRILKRAFLRLIK